MFKTNTKDQSNSIDYDHVSAVYVRADKLQYVPDGLNRIFRRMLFFKQLVDKL